MSKALVLGAAALVFSAAGALAADLVAPRYGYAAPADVATALVAAPPVYAAPVFHSIHCLRSADLRSAACLPGTTSLHSTARDERLLRSASGSAGAGI
jgi:hypothetical protein